MFGNVAQLKIGEFLDYKEFDHHLLTKVFRCNKELEDAAIAAKQRNLDAFKRIEIEDALKSGHTILAATHKTIEEINDIGLKMDLPRIIRFTKTQLKKDIFAGDMGVFKNGRCVNSRTGKAYKLKVGRNPMKDLVVYGYAQTYHSTQGQEMDHVILCIDGIKNWDMLYTGATRVHKLEEVMITSLIVPCGFDCKFSAIKHSHVGENAHVGRAIVPNWHK
jgi:ATP-dependent exoDNAse (exonuclease V) alpha subunit